MLLKLVDSSNNISIPLKHPLKNIEINISIIPGLLTSRRDCNV
jgi:hypothetical protein